MTYSGWRMRWDYLSEVYERDAARFRSSLRALAVIGGVADVVMLLGIAVLALLVRAIQLGRL